MKRRADDPSPAGILAVVLVLLATLLIVASILGFWIVQSRRQRAERPAAEQNARPEKPKASPDPSEETEAARTPPGGFPQSPESATVSLDYRAYTAAFSPETRTPLWVCYRLFRTDSPDLPRPDSDFHADPRAPVRVVDSAYSNSGFDRGHMAPSDAIGRCFGAAAQLETFMTTNICPQAPGLNQRCWERFEHKELNDYARSFGEVWIVDGPIFGRCRRLASGVQVPDAFYKIVYAKREGRTEALAIVMENERTERSRVGDYAVTIRSIETRSGLDFDSGLPDAEENALETSLSDDPRWDLRDELVPEFPGNPRTERVIECK